MPLKEETVFQAWPTFFVATKKLAKVRFGIILAIDVAISINYLKNPTHAIFFTFWSISEAFGLWHS